MFPSLDTPKEAEARETSAAIMTYRCPITDLPCQVHPFSALVDCGHLFSQRALQQVLPALCANDFPALCEVYHVNSV